VLFLTQGTQIINLYFILLYLKMTRIAVTLRPSKLRHYHHHQPINVPTAGAQAFLMVYT
jgi:hypothetical protein